MVLRRFTPPESTEPNYVWGRKFPEIVQEAFNDTLKDHSWQGIEGIETNREATALIQSMRTKCYRFHPKVKVQARAIQQPDKTYSITFRIIVRDE